MAPVVAATTSCTGRLPTGLNVLDMSDITQVFGHFNSSFTSQFQLLNRKSRDLQKLLKYSSGTTTSASSTLLLFGVLPIMVVLHSKDLLVIFLLLFILLPLLISITESFSSSP